MPTYFHPCYGIISILYFAAYYYNVADDFVGFV